MTRLESNFVPVDFKPVSEVSNNAQEEEAFLGCRLWMSRALAVVGSSLVGSLCLCHLDAMRDDN